MKGLSVEASHLAQSCICNRLLMSDVVAGHLHIFQQDLLLLGPTGGESPPSLSAPPLFLKSRSSQNFVMKL